MRIPHRIAIFALVALCFVLPLSSAKAQNENAGRSDEYGRNYQIKHLDAREAEILAWDQCPAEGFARCVVVSSEKDENGVLGLEVVADAATHAKIARTLYDRDRPAPTLAFQISLVRASTSGPSELTGLPEGAETAIADLKALLPYSSYSVLDVGFVRANHGARTSLSADGYRYEISLDVERGRGDEKTAEIRRFVVSQHSIPGKTSGKRTNLLSTSFGIDVGETVVVGTSKANGNDEALIVLVTASKT